MSGRIRMDEQDFQEGEGGQVRANNAGINPAQFPPRTEIPEGAENRQSADIQVTKPPGEVSASDREAGPSGQDAAGSPDAAETPEMFNRRIRTLTWEREQARRETERIRAEYEHFMSQARAAADPDERAIQEAMQRLQAKRAQEEQQQQQRSFDAACNATYIRGRTDYPDFDSDVQALNAMGADRRRDIVEFIANSPEGHKLYHRLAQDLDAAAELMKQPNGVAMRKLARMELELEAPTAGNGLTGGRPAPSRAPPPIRPIGGAGRGPRRMEDMDVGEWIAQRDKDEWEARRRR